MHYSCIIHSLTVAVGIFDLNRGLKCRLVLKTIIGDKNAALAKWLNEFLSFSKVRIALQRLFRTYN